jgi:hypothetical protein
MLLDSKKFGGDFCSKGPAQNGFVSATNEGRNCKGMNIYK